MKDWLRRKLPVPVFRALGSVYRYFRGIVHRWRRAAHIVFRGDDTAATLGSVRRDRDAVKGRLRDLRDELRRTRRDLAMARAGAGTIDDTWWDQKRSLASGGGELRDLAYFPGGSQNPYLRLLYAGTPEAGFEARPLASYDLLDRAPGSTVFHLHWTRTFQAGAASEEEARAQTDREFERLERFVGRGGRLLWSVHEWLPHDCEFPDVEVGLRRRLVELASGVHVLHASTVGEVEGLYPLDADRTFVVEHPLYVGVYPDYVNRGAARRLLGVGDDEVLLVGFGAIRPYKGFDRLVGLVPRLREETGHPIRVILAGPTYRNTEIQDLLDMVASTDGVSMSGRAVPDEFVQVLFRAADVSVLPYRQVLNSGVLMLALSFGCVSVAPENAVTRDAVGSGLVHLFDRESDESLFGAVVEAIERRHQPDDLPDAFLSRFDNGTLARQFAEELAARIGEE